MSDTYGAEPRFQTIIITPKSSSTENVVTKAAIAEVFKFVDALEAITVEVDGSTFSYTDLCLKYVAGPLSGECVQDGVHRYWSGSSTTFASAATDDAAVQTSAAASSYPDGERPRARARGSACSRERTT